jgi:hypothetical protein
MQMIRFDKRAALKIIAASCKRGEDGKLSGEPVLQPEMAENLVRVLQWAEGAWKEAASAAERDLARNKRLKITSAQRSFAKAVVRLSDTWGLLEPSERSNLVWASEPMLSDLNQWTDRPTAHIDDKVEEVRSAIAKIVGLTKGDVRVPPGHQGGLSATGKPMLPLRTFITLLKAWWELSTEQRFGQEFLEPIEGEELLPTSPAANFVCEAVSFLKISYSMGEVRTVMRELQIKHRREVVQVRE